MATIVSDPAREVLNQAPPLQPVNFFEVDVALREAIEREGGGMARRSAPGCRRGRRERRGARAFLAGRAQPSGAEVV